MPGKRRLAPTLWTSRNRLITAVAATVLLLTVVGIWSQAGRKPDPQSINPPQAEAIFPEPEEPVSFAPGDLLPSDEPPSAGPPGGGPPSEGPPTVPPAVVPTPPPPAGGGGGEQGGGGGDGGDNGGGQAPPPPAEETTPPPQEQEPPPPQQPDPPPPAVQGQFTSRYTTTENGARTFHARVFLTNRGSSTSDWTVRITFASGDGVSVGRTIGAVRRGTSGTVTFSGFNARAGQVEIFGFDATKSGSGTVRPIGCEIDGRACDIQ